MINFLLELYTVHSWKIDIAQNQKRLRLSRHEEVKSLLTIIETDQLIRYFQFLKKYPSK